MRSFDTYIVTNTMLYQIIGKMMYIRSSELALTYYNFIEVRFASLFFNIQTVRDPFHNQS